MKKLFLTLVILCFLSLTNNFSQITPKVTADMVLSGARVLAEGIKIGATGSLADVIFPDVNTVQFETANTRTLPAEINKSIDRIQELLASLTVAQYEEIEPIGLSIKRELLRFCEIPGVECDPDRFSAYPIKESNLQVIYFDSKAIPIDIFQGINYYDYGLKYSLENTFKEAINNPSILKTIKNLDPDCKPDTSKISCLDKIDQSEKSIEFNVLAVYNDKKLRRSGLIVFGCEDDSPYLFESHNLSTFKEIVGIKDIIKEPYMWEINARPIDEYDKIKGTFLFSTPFVSEMSRRNYNDNTVYKIVLNYPSLNQPHNPIIIYSSSEQAKILYEVWQEIEKCLRSQ